MLKANVATIIVNWRLGKDTVESIKSLDCSELPTSIIVVDNGSNDGSAEYIAECCPEVEMLALKTNIGFASACNLAISKVLKENKHDFIFFLNNDATVHPDILSELIKASKEYPDTGIFGAKVYYSDKPDTVWYAGARRRQGVLAATDTARGVLDYGQFEDCHEVDYIFGAAMLVRCEVFKKVGFFDPHFFLYLEDLDLCLRAQNTGYSLLFVPAAKVWHKGSASTSDNVSLRRYYMVKSTIHFLRKHTSAISRLPIFMLWVGIYFKDIFGDLIRGDMANFKAYGSGFLHGISGKRRCT
ncbi:glycosyltransferase [Candidatus Bathyarchaeota archaeon]|nr:glycosyltransferase [Candidatus Bathyarchaeota archaeon]